VNWSAIKDKEKEQGGFTLLEVLVSVAVIAIILTSLYSSFFMVSKAVDGLDDRLVRLQEMRMTIDMMRRELESAFFSWEKPYTIFRIDTSDIYGRDASSLVFTTFSPLTPGPVNLSYVVRGEGESLLRLEKEFRSGSGGGQDRTVEILDGIESFTVEARYKDNWVKTWDSKLSHELPEEIRITIIMNLTGKRYALSDVAKIRTGRAL
jgi:general secretion pathway protein J